MKRLGLIRTFTLCCVLAGSLAACLAAGIAGPELPEEPIAFRYRTPEEARRRAAALAQERSDGGPTAPLEARPTRSGRNDLVATPSDFGAILGRFFGGRYADRVPSGRLAFLHARDGRIEIVQSALPGSVPLAWSRDRSRLLFAQPRDGDFQIYEYDRGEVSTRRVTSGPRAHTQACYGEDGRIIVAVVDPDSDPLVSWIATSAPNGMSPFERVSPGPSDHSPACSPTSGEVAYVSELEVGRAEIRTWAPGEAGVSKRLTPGRHPSYSPDGVWVVFTAPRKRELRLWRIRRDGTGRAPLGQSTRHEARPAISPDGKLVAYVAAEERFRRHLYLRRFDGTGDRILFADGDGEYPVW